MARRSEFDDLVEVTSRIPWWLAVGIGAVLFGFFNFYLPPQISGALQPAASSLLPIFAYVLLAACLFGAIAGIARRAKERHIFNKQESIESIRSLGWPDFEWLVTEAFRRRGYRANRSTDGPDGGIDVILERDKRTTLVQCKHWKSARVGVKPVRELAGVIAAHGASGGIFVCSGDYTAEAVKFAKDARIELVDGVRLVNLIGLNPASRDSGSDTSSTAEHACPKCGSSLVRRVAKRGKATGSAFFGCSAFPKCRYTRNA